MSNHTSAVGMERKLAAIFSTDVAGYSRLMGDDEEATIRTLTTYRALISSLIQHHRGRVIDSPGDNLLAEFASVVDAVRCAVEIQHALTEKNGELSDHRQMHFRIGINLGDVIVEGERLYGDGVNIAARLESLAIPGGICISGTVYDHVKNKLALTYEDPGEQVVKNIADPVRVYRVAIEVPSPLVGEGQGEGAAKKAESSKFQVPAQPRSPDEAQRNLGKTPDPGLRSAPSRLLPVPRWAVAGLVLIAATFVTVRYFSFPTSTQPLAPSTQAAPAALPLPAKPSIVVLPFVNMSKDPDQEYFSDGITEDLTTALSQISSLFVIARNSAFTYKGKAVKVQEVGKELGVHYVLEGSVRRANDQVRITAQLIDAATESHLWAQRYDRPLKDIFALQDEIVQKIVTTLKLQLTLREQGYLVRKTTDNLEAYDAYLRGLEAWNRYTRETNARAQQLFEQVIALDPQYAEAYARLSRVLATEWVYFWNRDPQILERALVVAQQAVTLDASLAGAHEVLSFVYVYKKQHEQAITAAKRAIALAPNDAESYANLAHTLLFVGRPEEVISLVEKAMRLNPRYPAYYLSFLGMAYGLARRYEEALAALQSATLRNPNLVPAHLHLLLSYSELGRDADAQAELAELRRLLPNVSLERFRGMPFKDSASSERYLAALRKAGLK